MVRVPAATSIMLGLALALTCTKANAQHPPSLMEVRTAYRAACLAPANSEVVAAFNRTAEHWVEAIPPKPLRKAYSPQRA